MALCGDMKWNKVYGYRWQGFQNPSSTIHDTELPEAGYDSGEANRDQLHVQAQGLRL